MSRKQQQNKARGARSSARSAAAQGGKPATTNSANRAKEDCAKDDRLKNDVANDADGALGRPVNVVPGNPWWLAATVCAVLAPVTIYCYWGVRTSDFLTYDDLGYVLENQRVHQGVTLRSVEWAFTTFDAANWHPLTWISHMVDWKLYGKNAGGHHMTNVVWHTANAILLFLLLLYMTGFLWRAAMVAFLFALHPAHVESVAWISERKDVLCTFYWLAAMLAYAWYARRPSWKRMVWVAGSAACALLAKPMAVTLPFTLLLLDYWPLQRMTFAPKTRATRVSSSSFGKPFGRSVGRSFAKLCLEKWPLFTLAAISSVLTFSAQRASGAVAGLQVVPLWERICNAAISYWRYIAIMFWPNPLTAYYYHEKNMISVPLAGLAIIGLAAVTAGSLYIREQWPYCLWGWLWFLGTLAPVIGIVQVGDQAMAERYTYVPYVGLFVALVWLVAEAVAGAPKLVRAIAGVIAAGAILACGVKTEAQVKVWKNTETLFLHAIAIDPRGGIPYLSLGMAYGREGRTAEAEENFKRALDYNPTGALGLSYSAYYLMLTHEQRNLPLAGQRLQEALQVAPEYGPALTYMAQWSSLMGRPKDEETYARRALAAHSDTIEVRLYLADALQAQGKFDEAEQENRDILLAEPDNWEAHNNLGTIFAKRGLTDDALKELRRSLAIKPDQAVAYAQMGRILAGNHRYPEAVEAFRQALQFDLAKANAHNDLGVALFLEGKYEEAAEEFNQAVRINPEYQEGRKNLELTQARLKSGRAEKVTK